MMVFKRATIPRSMSTLNACSKAPGSQETLDANCLPVNPVPDFCKHSSTAVCSSLNAAGPAVSGESGLLTRTLELCPGRCCAPFCGFTSISFQVVTPLTA